MSDNRTYCPHCWAEVSKDDTTCCVCGEPIEHESPGRLSGRFVWSMVMLLSCVFWGVVLGVIL